MNILRNFSLLFKIFLIYSVLDSKRQTNALKKRRMEKGLTQRQMSEKLGITQSQYSKIDWGDRPYQIPQQTIQDSKCDPNDVFSGQILKDMEEEFLNDPIKETRVSITNAIPTKSM